MTFVGRFDAYKASVPATFDDIHDALASSLNPMSRQETPPLRNYLRGMTLSCPDGDVLIHHGGHNPDPLVQTQGDMSDALAEVLRRYFPNHTCPRADVCIDFAGGRDKFEEIKSSLCEIALQRGVRTDLIASPTDPDAGRTLYLGRRRNSEVFGRLYEKGRKERQDGHAEADLGWLRWEIEVKPGTRARKLQLASLPASEVAGFSRWSVRAQQAVGSLTVPFVPRRRDRQNPALLSFLHMQRQYRDTVAQLIRDVGFEQVRSMHDAWLEETRLRSVFQHPDAAADRRR